MNLRQTLSIKALELVNVFLKNNTKIKTLALNHPDGAVGYRIENRGKTVCYITDHEHNENIQNEELINFVKKSDVLIYDSTYEDEEFKKLYWLGTFYVAGRSKACKYSNVKKYFVFHHNPDNTDKEMEVIEKKSKLMGNNIIVAKEGDVCENIIMKDQKQRYLPDDYIFEQGDKGDKAYFST